jgi:MYXO-CTERM domain-containing protein
MVGTPELRLATRGGSMSRTRKALAVTVMAGGLALAPALDTVHAQDDAVTEDDDGDDNTGLWGLVGLLGLAGLAGLRRRDTRTIDRRTTTATDAGLR